MKKLLLFLVLSLCLCLFVTACGEDNTTTASENTSTITTVSTSTVASTDTTNTTDTSDTAPIATTAGVTTNAPTSTQAPTTTERPDYTNYTPNHDYVFFCEESAFLQDQPIQLGGAQTAGIKFSVAENTYLTSLVGYCPSWLNNTGYLSVSIYRWVNDYDTTVAGDAVITKTFVDFFDNSPLNLYIEDGLVGEGEWYAEYHDGSAHDLVGIWSNYMPPATNDYVTFENAYRDGQIMTGTMPYCYGTYVTYQKNTEEVTAQPFTKLNSNKAHVIILTGQSNASGNSSADYLKLTATPEDYARYQAGFENILIDYAVDGAAQSWQRSNGFVPVKLGQATQANYYGPEIGLADYLTKTYPGETFYIIKPSWSGTSLVDHWQDNQVPYQFVQSNLTASLNRLKDMGLDPEIFAFCWMQGESDAGNTLYAQNYAENFDNMLTRLFAPHKNLIAENGMAILDAAISESPLWLFGNIINAEKQEFAKASPNRYYIDTVTEGLGCMTENNDPAHYDSQDMIRLGELFGEHITKVIENSKK